MRAPLLDDPLTNSQLSELLAGAGEDTKPPLSKAYRRASRKALLWPEEASSLYQAGRSLTELRGVGPYLEKAIRKWIESSPALGSPPDTRENFLTRTQVRAILEKQPSWASRLMRNLQMLKLWSDGSASIQEMAEAGDARGYEYIAITDHSKGLKIVGGINEEQLRQQVLEIAAINESLGATGTTLRVLRSIEVNLNPAG
jgi:putative hydrolase